MGMLHSGSVGWLYGDGHADLWTNRDHAAFTALVCLQFRALSLRLFERYYATLVPRYGDPGELGVMTHLLVRAIRQPAAQR